MWQAIVDPALWIGLGQIVWIDLLLSGDNAVVIALAARDLPSRRRKGAIVLGAAVATLLRIVLAMFALSLLQWPYLKLAGAGLLVWIGVELFRPERRQRPGRALHSLPTLWAAVRTILIADFVMSLDNVLAIAAVAGSGPAAYRMPLLVIGLAVSIPPIVIGSGYLIDIMKRWPIIITLGAALIGFVAGGMAATDPGLPVTLDPEWELLAELACAVAVVLLGRLRDRGTRSKVQGQRRPRTLTPK